MNFKAQEAVNAYSQATPGGPTGYDPLTEADAVSSAGKKGWELWVHETTPGVGVVKVWHAGRPTGVVTIPLGTVKSYEERWQESPYKELLIKEAADKAAAKLADSDKAAAKK